jgi:hypothetical protein
MKSAVLVFAGGALLVASSLGCHNPSANNDLVLLNTVTLDAPTTVAPSAMLTVGLDIQVGGCLLFDHIEARRTASYVDLTVWGRDIRSGITDRAILCPREFLERHEYQIEPPFQNTFTVQVDRGRLSPLIATVQVR